MGVQRIDSDSTHGWQARAHLAPGKRLTRFFSDSLNGGWAAAQARAMREEKRLKQRARELLADELGAGNGPTSRGTA